jgi:hypothetical protein
MAKEKEKQEKQEKQDETGLLIGIESLSRYTGLSHIRINALLQLEYLDYFKIGSVYFFHKETVEKCLIKLTELRGVAIY